MALVYSRLVLKTISSNIPTRYPSDLWRRLIYHGVSRVKPTRRGCRGGRRKQTEFNHSPSQDLQPGFSSVWRLNFPETSVFGFSAQSVRNSEDKAVLHILNFQDLRG